MNELGKLLSHVRIYKRFQRLILNTRIGHLSRRPQGEEVVSLRMQLQTLESVYTTKHIRNEVEGERGMVMRRRPCTVIPGPRD